MYSKSTLNAIIWNIISVVGIVVLNKHLSQKEGVTQVVLLSSFHFLFTMVGVRILLGLNFFEYKAAQMSKVVPVALGSISSVAFMNLNLKSNSVGFYQLSKLFCIPFAILLERCIYGKKVSKEVQLTLVPVILGVGIATVSDTSLNFIGTVYALLAVVCTTCAQVFTSRFQKELKCNGLQLLYHTSPLISIGMLLLSLTMEGIPGISFTFQPTIGAMYIIIISCAFALMVNVTNYVVLGKTDALTYQIVGHFKTICIIVLGYLLFNHRASVKNIAGIAIALLGVVGYTEVKRKQEGNNSKQMPLRMRAPSTPTAKL
eukprot:181519_1